MKRQLLKGLLLFYFLLFSQSCTTVDETSSKPQNIVAFSKEGQQPIGLKIIKKSQANNDFKGNLSYTSREESDNPCYVIDCDKQEQSVPDEERPDLIGPLPHKKLAIIKESNPIQNYISPDEDIDFIQATDKYPPGSIQAINLIYVSDLLGFNNDIEQNIEVRDFRFYEPNSNNRLQAGNAVITDGVHSGKIKQTWKSRRLIMIQENENNSIQAVNYIGIAPSSKIEKR